jgi:hypothetical protein
LLVGWLASAFRCGSIPVFGKGRLNDLNGLRVQGLATMAAQACSR